MIPSAFGQHLKRYFSAFDLSQMSDADSDFMVKDL